MSNKSYTLDGSGNTITSSIVGAGRGLDVNVLNTITAELDAGAGVGINTITATSPMPASLTGALPAGANTIGAGVISGTTTSRIPVSADTGTTIVVGTSTSLIPGNLNDCRI